MLVSVASWVLLKGVQRYGNNWVQDQSCTEDSPLLPSVTSPNGSIMQNEDALAQQPKPFGINDVS